MSFLSISKLNECGFKYVGKNVLISDKCSLYGCSNISIGDNVRIDDFCILSAGKGFIEIGSHIHIAAYTSLFGSGGIRMGDFSGLSSYVSVYSGSDDYRGDFLIGPIIDEDLINVIKKTVTLEKYTIVGSHSVILPGGNLLEGSALGANSLTSKTIPEWKIYSGSPAKELKDRKKGLLDKAKIMLKRRSESNI